MFCFTLQEVYGLGYPAVFPRYKTQTQNFLNDSIQSLNKKNFMWWKKKELNKLFNLDVHVL